MNIYTIGFTKKSAERFFGLLRDSGARSLLDVRLNNVSQLAGFAKRDDLAYFLREIAGMSYRHEPELAPTQDLLDEYKKRGGQWDVYRESFLALMSDRRIEASFSRELFEDSVLLCSEDKPHNCHRRLVAEYLSDHWGGIEIQHLV